LLQLKYDNVAAESSMQIKQYLVDTSSRVNTSTASPATTLSGSTSIGTTTNPNRRHELVKKKMILESRQGAAKVQMEEDFDFQELINSKASKKAATLQGFGASRCIKLIASGIKNGRQLVAAHRQEVPSEALKKLKEEKLSGKPNQRDTIVQGWVEKIEAEIEVREKKFKAADETLQHFLTTKFDVVETASAEVETLSDEVSKRGSSSRVGSSKVASKIFKVDDTGWLQCSFFKPSFD
jgi:hypothetical protein